MQDKKYCFGVDIGGTTVKLGLFTCEGELVDKWEIDTDRSEGGKNVLEDIAGALNKKLSEKSIDKAEVKGVGIGVPGPVLADGTVMKCANLGWDVFNVNERASQLTGFPAKALNDANAAALGEMWRGGGRGFKNMIFITLGTGVGGAIIIDGQVHYGVHGGGGEIGHIIVNPNETAVCGCGGRGHLEQYASATGIVRMAQEMFADSSVSSTLRQLDKITAKDIFDAAKAGDAAALKLVDKMCLYLAQALSGAAAAADPEVYVIGGGVSKAGEIITQGVKEHFNGNCLNVFKDKEFKLATLGNDAGMYGAAALIAGL